MSSVPLRPSDVEITHADRLLMRELWTPTDDSIPLTAREIAEKFDVSIGRVYAVVHMSEACLDRLAVREGLGR